MDPNKPRSITPRSFEAVVDAVEVEMGSTSLAPEVKVAKERTSQLMLVLGTFTDWLGVLTFAVFVLAGKMTAEAAAPWIAGALTGAIINKARGKAGGSSTAVLFAVAGKIGLAGVAKGAGMMGLVLLMGCATLAPLAVDAMKAILPAARDALVQEAERRGAEMDTNEAICFAAPDEYQPDDYLLVTCIAPERDE